jgi:REP element-mobilizing transposase RayT
MTADYPNRLAAVRRTALGPDPAGSSSDAVLRTAAKQGVLAYHVIFGAYGFWLPNDPRGSWSDFVAAWELFRSGGPATKTATRHSLAGVPHDAAARRRVKEALKYPAVVFNGHQALSVARGFARVVKKSGYRVHACTILPEHVHLVLGRHRYRVEQMVRLLKAEASTQLAADGRHPLAAWARPGEPLPTPWARNCWRVFLDSAEAIDRAVRYVEGNPLKEGKPPQGWSFVVPYVEAV